MVIFMNNNNDKYVVFINELKREAKRLASHYGIDLPDFPVIETDYSFSMNVTAYKGESSAYFSKLYLDRCKEIGMEPDWLDVVFLSNDKSITFSIVGLDPDGGDQCVRLKGDDGGDYYMSPSAVTYLIRSEQKLP